jgi:hypothetical protein
LMLGSMTTFSVQEIAVSGRISPLLEKFTLCFIWMIL